MSKVMTALSAVCSSTQCGIGDADGSMYLFEVGDDGTMGDEADFQIPAKGGYIITPIEARVNAWHNLTRESGADITIADVVQLTHNVSATTGAGTSQAMDSIDYTTDGLFLVAGTSTDPDCSFQDFVDADEGSGLTGAGRAGIWASGAGGFTAYLHNVVGRTDAGTSTLTEFTDAGTSVTFPGGYVSDGRNGLEFDLATSGTTVIMSDGRIAGSDRRFGGRSKIKRYFDTELDVIGGTTDTITIVGHGLYTGDTVIYSAEGGTEDIGPDATTGEAEFNNATAGVIGTGAYWGVVKVDDDTIQLATTPALAYAGTGRTITPSTTGNGENHSLERAPDTRPNLLFTGTTGTADLTRMTLSKCRVITMTSAVTMTGGVISQCRQLILGDGTLDTCIIAQPTTSIGEAFLQAIHGEDLDLIDNSTFTSGGLGHAIEITTDGTVDEDIASLVGVGFSGYWEGDDDNTGGVAFDPDETGNPGDVNLSTDAITITGHPFTDGDPVYYSDEGGTAITGLTDQGLYYVNSIDANTISLHDSETGATSDTNRANMTAASTDAEHKLYSANAAIFNDTGTAITVNVTGGDSPSVRNSAGSTTTVNNTVTLTVQVNDSDGDPVNQAKVRIENTSTGAQIAQGTTNASGTYVNSSYNYAGDLGVTTKVRLKGYKNFRTGGTIESTGLTVGVTLADDKIVDLP
jgi:hypothetical protein